MNPAEMLALQNSEARLETEVPQYGQSPVGVLPDFFNQGDRYV